MTEPFLEYCPLADSLCGNIKEIRKIEEYADLVWGCVCISWHKKSRRKGKTASKKRERTKIPYMTY